MALKFANYRMQVYEKPSLVDTKNATINIGESIQYLAIKQIYNDLNIDKRDIVNLTAREAKEYVGDPMILPGKFILNDRVINRVLPFSKDIIPVLISSVMLKNEEISNELIKYLKGNEPIGCRDEQTRIMLRELGIDAYLMGCFTMCLPQRSVGPKNGKIILVDVSKKLLEYMPLELKNNAVYITHSIHINTSKVTVEDDERLNAQAKELLDFYSREAKLVITSRLHAAAPCIAMGIPVILASDNIDFRYGWIDKFIPIYTLDEYSQINWQPTVICTDKVKEWIRNYIKKRIEGDYTAVEELKKLDDFYMNRCRADYYGFFEKRIQKAYKMIGKKDFKYIIWGAGLHSGYAYDIITKQFPKAELVAIIDKFEKGRRFNKMIITGDELKTSNFDIAFITTKPGTAEAIAKIEEFFGKEAKKHYIIITSQQIS